MAMITEPPALAALVFSKDRAMQLDLTLQSFLLHCRDARDFPLTVLYAAGDRRHARQYATLQGEYARHPSIRFQRQGNFWRDVLHFLAAQAGPGPRFARFQRGLWLGSCGGAWRSSLPAARPQQTVLFLVDDNIFVRPFSLRSAAGALEQMPSAIGFSLRLGANTTDCYTAARPQRLPEFTPVDAGMLAFDWTRGELDFGYPLEVSSSMYRIADLLPWLHRRSFRDPNDLEIRLAEQAPAMRNFRRLLCFQESVTFCNPVNRVNRRYQNRAGETHPISNEALAERFDAGQRVDASAYAGFAPHACHQEVAFVWRTPAGHSPQSQSRSNGEADR